MITLTSSTADMSTQHTPLIQLSHARREYHAAHENCPHWNYEGTDTSLHECCYALDDARRAYLRARRAVEKEAMTSKNS
jgi:hypothetical protein